MKEIQLTKGYVTLVDDQDFEWLNQWKWRAHLNKNSNTVYAERSQTENGKVKSYAMHRVILGLTEHNIQGDHHDLNGLNNQRYNLRIATNIENNQNKPVRIDNKAGFKGVFMVRNKYRSTVYLNGNHYNCSTFNTAIEASIAYNVKAKEIHGSFACLSQ